MNERIKELAMQTDIWCDQNVAQGHPMYTIQWEQKFAELLVRECADFVDRAISDGGIDGRSLKEHFGVEQ